MQKKVTLLIRIRVGKRYPFAEPVYSANGKLKPLWAMVDGRPEHHLEGTYHLRYHRKIHPSVGNPVHVCNLPAVRGDSVARR